MSEKHYNLGHRETKRKRKFLLLYRLWGFDWNIQTKVSQCVFVCWRNAVTAQVLLKNTANISDHNKITSVAWQQEGNGFEPRAKPFPRGVCCVCVFPFTFNPTFQRQAKAWTVTVHCQQASTWVPLFVLVLWRSGVGVFHPMLTVTDSSIDWLFW